METPLSVSDLVSRHDAVSPYFQSLWTSGEENEIYKKGENWTEAQKAQIEGQSRVPYAVPLTAAKLNQVLAYQRNSRTEFNLRALADPRDEIKAEIGKIIFKDFEHQNNFEYLESDVFDSGVAVKYGVVGIYVDKDDDYRDVVRVREIDYKNFVWDANATTYEKDDALFMAEIDKVYRYQIREEYGRDAARKVSSNDSTWGRNKSSYFISPNENEDYDIISKFTHYEKVVRQYYCVLFNDYQNLLGLAEQNVVAKFRNKKDAEYRLRELQAEYIVRGLPLGESSVVPETRVMLDKYVFTIDNILEYEETELETFPYSIYQSYQYKDAIWSLTDLLKSMQKFIDRYISQIDYSFGKDIKNVYELAVNQLADGLTYEKALEIIEDSGVVPVKMTGAMQAVRGQGINPQWIQMTQMMQSFLEDLSGGRSFQGLQENAKESGRAIIAKQQQGELIASLFIDNLRRWKRDLGKKLLWWFNRYDTAERVIKVGGGEISQEMMQVLMQEGVAQPSLKEKDSGYIKINSHPLTVLKDAKFELVVTDSPLSETRQTQKFAQLALIPQFAPQISMIPEFVALLLENANVPYEERKKILAGMQAQAEAQAQAQQQDLDIKKAQVLVSDKGNQTQMAKVISDSNRERQTA